MSRVDSENWEKWFWFVCAITQIVALASRLEKDIRGLDGHLQIVRDNWTPAGSPWDIFVLCAFSFTSIVFIVKWARA